MTTATKKRASRKAAKTKLPAPHPDAKVADAPCENCGCEWVRITVNFDAQVQETFGTACANAWCAPIKAFRDRIATLKSQRLLLAKLAAKTPLFDNPLIAWEAEALRDKLLNGETV